MQLAGKGLHQFLETIVSANGGNEETCNTGFQLHGYG